MVRYLKYIVLIFGGIGVLAGSFFYLQNKKDISAALDYRSRIDYDFLRSSCSLPIGESIFSCLKTEFDSYLKEVSLTGTSFGLKMVFNVLDEDKDSLTRFKDENLKNFFYSLHYLELNNMAMNNVYRRYHGFSFLYGGFVASLKQYNAKARRFSQDIIIGLEGPKGLVLIKDSEEYDEFFKRFNRVKNEYYKIKTESDDYIEKEWERLEASSN